MSQAFISFILFYRYNLLRLERFILNDNIIAFMVRDGFPEFFILINVWTMKILEIIIRTVRKRC